MFVLTAMILLTAARDWLVRVRGAAIGGRAVAIGAAVVTVALCGATGFFVARTGHLGAKATWQEEPGG